MSKTTIALLVILCIFVGILLYVLYGSKQNTIITSLRQTLRNSKAVSNTNTTLSFSTIRTSIYPGQSISVAVLLHNPNPHPDLVQLEIAYDPTMLTVNAIALGNFFTEPTIALQNIDPVTGRISYALRCSENQTTIATDCVNQASSTLAVISFSVNSYAVKYTTTLSFLPKTVIRAQNGRDILQQATPLQLTLTKSLYPVSSSSAIGSPGANFIHITPIH